MVLFQFLSLLLSVSTILAVQQESEISSELAANVAQLTGNVIAQVAHGHSLTSAAFSEFEWMIVGILTNIGADRLISMIGLIPGNLVSSVCIQAVTPVCKEFCGRFLSRILRNASTKLDVSHGFYPEMQKTFELALNDDFQFRRFLDGDGLDQPVFSFYLSQPKEVLENALIRASKNNEISLDAVNQLLKIGQIDLGLLQKVLNLAAEAKNWRFVERILEEKFLNVSQSSNKLLQLALSDNQEHIVLKIIKHSSFDATAGGLSMINWAARQNYIVVLSELINDGSLQTSFDSGLVFKRLCESLTHAANKNEKKYLMKTIFKLFEKSNFKPSYLIFTAIHLDLFEFIPDILGHKNTRILPNEIDYLNFYKKSTDEYQKTLINMGLALWALRNQNTEMVASILKEEQDPDFKINFIKKGCYLGLRNIITFMDNNVIDRDRFRMVLDLKSENWQSLYRRYKRLDTPVSQNKNEFLKSIFVEYRKAESDLKPFLARFIDEIVAHKSFSLFKDQKTLPLFIKEVCFGQEISEKDVIVKWINRMIRHKTYIPSTNVGELIIRYMLDLQPDALGASFSKTWLNKLASSHILRTKKDNHDLIMILVDGFLRAKGEVKLILSASIYKLLVSSSFNPSLYGNSLASKLLNNLHTSDDPGKPLIVDFLNIILLHPLFQPSLKENDLLMDLIEYYDIVSDSQKTQIATWIDIIIDHPRFKPSVGHNRIIHRLIVQYKLQSLWRSRKVQQWVEKVISNPHFICESVLDNINSAFKSSVGYKRMIMNGWVRKLYNMEYGFSQITISQYNVGLRKIKKD